MTPTIPTSRISTSRIPTSRTFRALVSVAAALCLLAPAALQAQARATLVPNRLTQPINDNARVTLKGTVHPLANAFNDRGAVSASMPLDRIQIVLKRSPAQQAALRQLIEDQNRPGSANYHKWLTPAQFGQQFGPSDQDVATLESWLQSQGFNIVKLNPGRQTLEVSASASQFQNAFHAQIHKYSVNGQIHFANATNPQIPAALAPVFGGFASLNDFKLKPKAQIRGKATYNPKTGKATPQWTMGTGATQSFVLSPADFAVQYDLNPLYTAGTNGAGQTIAIINGSNINVAMVNAFRSTFNLPFNPPQVVIDGNDPGVDGVNNPDGPNGYSPEAYVDVEWAGATAPNATVDLVIASDTALESGLILAAEHAIYGNIAPVLSFSFGFCESGLTSENAFINNLWEQAAAQGITVLVASGDSGSAGCDDSNSQQYATQGAAISGFASTPYNVAVGGTDFFYSSYNQGASAISSQLANDWNTASSNGAATVSIKGYIPEQPWNDSQFGLNLFAVAQGSTIVGAGGGPSTCGKPTLDSTGNVTACAPYPKPSWQTGAGVPNDNARDIPDVSLFAADGVNASYYPTCIDDGDCQGPGSDGVIQISGGGGTSFASPAFAGIMALVNQKYGRQGQADSVLYPLAAQFPAAFHDVTNGNNSVPCAYSPSSSSNSKNCIAVSDPMTVNGVTEGQIGVSGKTAYNAGGGYDLASGLGTVDATQLVNHWGDVTFASSNVTLTPSSTSFAHGTAINITGTVTGSNPTGSVALMTDSGEQSQQGQGISQFLSGASSVFTVANGAFSGSNINTLPGGTYNIWGQYSGDATNAPSTSQKTSITVTPEASGIILNVLSPSGNSFGTIPSSVTYGTQLQFQAVVTPSSQLTAEKNCLTGSATTCPVYGPPTGTVTFADSLAPFNTATLNAEGDAEYNPMDLTVARSVTNVGSHSITATYSGDNSYNTSTATAITYTVTKATPTMNVYLSPDTPQAGQPTVFTVVVQSSGVGAPPTGTVTISGGPSGTPTTVALQPGVSPVTQTNPTSNSDGVALVTVPATAPAGDYSMTFTYSGDTNYAAATPATGTLTIAPKSSLKPSVTTITTSASATSPTAQLSISVTVTGDGTTVPTGSVELQSSGYIIATLTLSPISGTKNAGAIVSGNSTNYLQGANLLTAIYSGDTNYAGSSATAAVANPHADFTMTPATTLIPVTPGTPATDKIQLATVNTVLSSVNLTCTAASGITCAVSPNGVVFAPNSNSSTTLTLNVAPTVANGTYAVLVTGTDSSGQIIHTLGLQAQVTGATTAAASFTVNANSPTLIVAPGATSTEGVSVLPANGFTGAVALTASITNAPNGATSPPTLAFTPTSLAINGASAISSALAVTTTASTTEGNYTVMVTGRSGSEVETSQFTVTVSSAGFSLAANPTSLTLSAGATTANISAITVTPTGGFTGAVNFTCAVTTAPPSANDPPTCSAPSATVSSGAATTTLTVTTTASRTSANHNPLNKFFAASGGVVMAGLLFFGIPARRRKWRSILLILLFAGIAGFGIGCGSSGGGNNGGGGGGTTIPGTTSGNYVLTVTGISGSVTATTTVNLKVN